jgi:hypothetical protein
VISYLAARTAKDPILFAHQITTRRWWNEYRKQFDLYISRTVWDEISEGTPELIKRRQHVVKGIRWLQIHKDAAELTKALLDGGPIPPRAATDAAHIALAAVHDIEFLLTWNFAHIANVSNENWIRARCAKFGFALPALCTPEQLMELF